jgi:Domain of unknown function (DUF4394)
MDHNNNKLFQVNPPNNGTLVLVGNLWVDVPAENGFEIGETSNNAYAVFKSGHKTNIYRISTTTGHAIKTGSLGNVVINGFAIGLGF